MKKCPTCEKTFDDSLKFCQLDGTPLVAVEEEKPQDPYKTIVANQDDLPIPPFDPLKTMVANPPPTEAKEPAKDVEDVLELDDRESPKTTTYSNNPAFRQELNSEVEEPQLDVPPPPPSPFGERASTPIEAKSQIANDASNNPPATPKFSEPNLNPPNFNEEASKPMSPPEIPLKPAKTAQPPAERKPTEDIYLSGPLGGPPYGDPNNAPIPSPFDLSMPPGYQVPSAPMPPYKDAAKIEEIKAEALNTPFADEIKHENQQVGQQNWNPPPSPDANWQDQQIGQNTPFNPPVAGTQGENKTLAIVALVLGILSIPCCGFFSGIPAVVVGFMAKSKAENSPQEFGGRGLALAGIITGAIGTVLSIILFILQLILGGLANIGNF